MLTKEERAAIAERLKSTEYITSSTLFKALTGEEKLSETSHVKSLCIICSVILGLCDTSNMIELPIDKDGEVIKVGDTVYNEAGDRLKVLGIEYSYCDRVYVNACYVGRQDKDVFFPNELTHKVTTTITENIEAFNEAVKVTAQYVEASMNECVEAMKKLAEVFNRVVDSDE